MSGNETNYTPGPLRVFRFHETMHAVQTVNPSAKVGAGHETAVCRNPGDAELYAVAPELVDVAEDMLTWLEEWRGELEADGHEEVAALIEKARPIVDRAKGFRTGTDTDQHGPSDTDPAVRNS